MQTAAVPPDGEGEAAKDGAQASTAAAAKNDDDNVEILDNDVEEVRLVSPVASSMAKRPAADEGDDGDGQPGEAKRRKLG